MAAALEKRKQDESVETSILHTEAEGPRRSQRLLTQSEQGRLHLELEQCRAELLARTEGTCGF